MALTYYGSATAAAGLGVGLTPASGNNGYTGSAAQTWLRRSFIDVLEENLYFYRYGMMEEIKNGYLTHSWARMEKTSHTAFTRTTAGGGLLGNPPETGFSVGQTPDDTNQPVGTISVNPEQYAIVNTIADMMLDFSVLDLVKQGMMHFANAAARRIDFDIQNVIYNRLSAISDAVYFVDHAAPKAITAIAGYEGSNYIDANIGNGRMRMSDCAALATKLKNNSAPMYNASGADSGFYMLIVHTFVAFHLMTEAGQTGFVNVFAQTSENVRRMVNGYVGTVYGMSIVQSPFVQTKESSTGNDKVVVYPSYAMAMGLYGVLKYRFQTYYTPASAISDSDPLGQRAKYGVKYTFNSIVLDPDCGVVAYSVGDTV